MEPTHDHSDCYIEQFQHRLPHRGPASLQRCGHMACAPHTLTYYGSGSDPELEGDYCMVCFGVHFGSWPDRALQQGFDDGNLK